MKIVARGAEAVLRKDGQKLVKDRVRKGYRVRELDERIRGQRTRTEERLLGRARRAGVLAPRVWEAFGTEIVMEWVDGPTVKECLNGLARKERLRVYEQIGRAAASLHRAGIMHGDLTTSNMIISSSRPDDEGEGRTRFGSGEAGSLYVIDFGLARASQRVEDFAVDLFLLYEALKAAHFGFLDEAWKSIIKAYKHNYTIAGQVLERLSKIERRRRYRGE
jgi:TP53 regulating kinase-like protein